MIKYTKRDWTKEEDDYLSKLIKYKFKRKDIAKLLNRTKNSIQCRVGILRLTLKPESIKIGYRQKYGFLEIVELLPLYTCKCICHNCGGIYVGSRSKVKNENRKHCGCLAKNQRICKNCHKINIGTAPFCIYCGYKNIKNSISLLDKNPELASELLDKTIASKISYSSSKKVEWKCSKCGYIWKTSVDNRSRRNIIGCIKCNKSCGEKIISNILDIYNIRYKSEQIFDGCKNKRNLKFDFYLPDHDICIEYQGLWHYQKHWSDKTNKTLKLSQKRDGIKRRFCKKNNILLLEIPYWKQNCIENILLVYLIENIDPKKIMDDVLRDMWAITKKQLIEIKMYVYKE
jgi:hypothetical protein